VGSAELYHRDYYAWIQRQVQALREPRLEDVDWANAAEEIEDLGKSERRGLQKPTEQAVGASLENVVHARRPSGEQSPRMATERQGDTHRDRGSAQ
jgi:hypothetical protein